MFLSEHKCMGIDVSIYFIDFFRDFVKIGWCRKFVIFQAVQKSCEKKYMLLTKRGLILEGLSFRFVKEWLLAVNYFRKIASSFIFDRDVNMHLPYQTISNVNAFIEPLPLFSVVAGQKSFCKTSLKNCVKQPVFL